MNFQMPEKTNPQQTTEKPSEKSAEHPAKPERTKSAYELDPNPNKMMIHMNLPEGCGGRLPPDDPAAGVYFS